MKTISSGEVSKQRKMIAEMLAGCWHACNSPDELSQQSFSADLILANPPSFAGISCAEALSIPCVRLATIN